MKSLAFRIWFSTKSSRECFLTSVAIKICLVIIFLYTITCEEEMDVPGSPQRNIESKYIRNFLPYLNSIWLLNKVLLFFAHQLGAFQLGKSMLLFMKTDLSI